MSHLKKNPVTLVSQYGPSKISDNYAFLSLFFILTHIFKAWDMYKSG